jgi:PPP family 3-phenylpropionic acid transporter
MADKRDAIIRCNTVILAVHVLLFFSTDAWAVCIIWLIAGVAMHAKVPITDASALSITRYNGSDFARVRMFGSIGFIVAIGVAGYSYERWGIGVFVVGLLLANVLRLACACLLPRQPQSQKQPPDRSCDIVATDSLLLPGILLTLIAAALINASHAMVYTYGILLWTQQGLTESIASLAVAIGVVVEVALMWWFRSLTQHLSARLCLICASGCGILRWGLLAGGPSVWVIFAAQALHGITFGIMFLATAGFISRRVPEHMGARGQSLFATLSTACMAVATYVAGQLFETWAESIYWLMAGMCLLAMICIILSYLPGIVGQSTADDAQR